MRSYNHCNLLFSYLEPQVWNKTLYLRVWEKAHLSPSRWQLATLLASSVVMQVAINTPRWFSWRPATWESSVYRWHSCWSNTKHQYAWRIIFLQQSTFQCLPPCHGRSHQPALSKPRRLDCVTRTTISYWSHKFYIFCSCGLEFSSTTPSQS